MTPFHIAGQLRGRVAERAGGRHHPFVQWAHELAGLGEGQPDEIAWCGSCMTVLAVLFGLPTPKLPARARSWLTVGQPVELKDAVVGFDVVVLKRGTGTQPGPEVLAATGHVGLYGGRDGDHVVVRGGNQSNAITDQRFPVTQVLGIRRLA